MLTRILSIVVWTIALFFLVVTAIFLMTPRRTPPISTRCMQNLKMLVLAMRIYCDENGGWTPQNKVGWASTTERYEGLGLKGNNFICPALKAKPERLGDALSWTSYRFITDVNVTALPTDETVLVYCPAANHKRRNEPIVGFLDGHVFRHGISDFNDLMQRQAIKKNQ